MSVHMYNDHADVMSKYCKVMSFRGITRKETGK